MSRSRREVVGLAFGAVIALASRQYALASSSRTALDADWLVFKSRFVSPDGRVVDTGNSDISHSEGQGYGLLFAVAADDRSAFDLIHSWTVRHLAVRPSDRLHAWRFHPGSAITPSDLNNATDGDLLIALALSRAAAAWVRPEFAAEAAALFSDVARLTVRDVGVRTVLLPGSSGFVHDDGVVLNLSYLVLPALAAAAASASPGPGRALWERVRSDGVGLVGTARFGRWGLPPDWLRLPSSGTPSPAHGWPARFSYDAVRVPLNLMWGSEPDPAGAARFPSYWNSFGVEAIPAWVDVSDDAVAPYPASQGVRAVAHCTGLSDVPGAMPTSLPPLGLDQDYYSSALTILARLAWTEGHPA